MKKPNRKYMYHLTDADNIDKILEHGLKPSTTDLMPCSKPNRIYLLSTNKRYVTCMVATNQLFLSPHKQVARIEIPIKKCNGLRRDIVGEYTSYLGYQWYCKNKVIKSQFFNNIEVFDFTEEDYNDSRKMIQKRIYTPKMFRAIMEQEQLWLQMGSPEHIGIAHNQRDETAELFDMREQEITYPTATEDDGERFLLHPND